MPNIPTKKCVVWYNQCIYYFQDIQQFIDSADMIVIFTMGFIFNSDIVPQERLDAFMDAFRAFENGPVK